MEGFTGTEASSSPDASRTRNIPAQAARGGLKVLSFLAATGVSLYADLSCRATCQGFRTPVIAGGSLMRLPHLSSKAFAKHGLALVCRRRYRYVQTRMDSAGRIANLALKREPPSCSNLLPSGVRHLDFEVQAN